MNQTQTAAIAVADSQATDAGLPTYTELLNALCGIAPALEARMPGSLIGHELKALLGRIELSNTRQYPKNCYPKYGHTYPH